jgi:nucleoside-diphosphate-sugar epimerase
MRILLTGGHGFLARQCRLELAARGHDVVTTDQRGRVDHVGDLADARFCATLPPVDVVVHAAAVQYVSQDLPWARRRAYFWHNNVEATRQLCAAYAGRSTRFVNVGTSMMYAQDGSAVYRTSSPMSGQGLYSRSKLAAQAHVNALPNPTATIIPCIIGGAGREGLFRSFVTTIRRLGAVAIPGAGRHKTSMVHVDDVASLIGCVVDSEAQGVFNAAAPDPLSIEQWIDEISRELRLGTVRRIHLPLAPIHMLSAVTGYRILAREQLLMLAQPHVLGIEESLAIGWRPRFDNAQIVKDIARHISETDRESLTAEIG